MTDFIAAHPWWSLGLYFVGICILLFEYGRTYKQEKQMEFEDGASIFVAALFWPLSMIAGFCMAMFRFGKRFSR